MFGVPCSEETREKLSKSMMADPQRTKMVDAYGLLAANDANTQCGYVAWRAPNADKTLWLKAEIVHSLYVSGGRCGQKRLASRMDDEYSSSAMATMYKKL